LIEGVDPLSAAWESLYLSAMAFTNTGFLPTSEGLGPYTEDVWFLTALMIGVVAGAIGFPIIYVLTRNLRHARRWSLHVKLTILTFVVLFVGGLLAYLVLEWDNTMRDMDAGQRVLQSAFISVMARSGGFATIDMSQLDGSSLLITDMLMFIGGGSASTAGGIKVTTLAILFLAAFAEARGHDDMEAYERRIPADVLRLGVSVVLWGATTVAGASIILLLITDEPLDYVLFDVISAFATCGLSTGFTQNASDGAQYVLAATMFFGRIGTVTLAAALAASQHPRMFRRPEERPIVG
jgi:trk system potassium uptake protein